MITYQDFDLLIEPAQSGTYRARVMGSPAGESSSIEFDLPSGLELENFLLKLGRPRRGSVRGVGNPEAAPLKAFGGRLYDSVFQGEVREILMRSLSEASREGAGLRLRLRFGGSSKLAELPWEFLYDLRRNRFLALSHHTPLVRFLELPDPPHGLTVQGPLRILVMISGPRDYAELDVEQEWARLTGAVSELQATGQVDVYRLEEATLAALQGRLRRGAFHVFHFIGHGGYIPDWHDGVLVFEDDAGRGRKVSGEELGGLLDDHEPMRLAVLNACEGARTSGTDPFAGPAQSLIQQGLPAVVAMQFEITDAAAITFCHEFYRSVADGYPVDAAVAEGRRAIRSAGNELEWATPVLYSRAPSGHIFDVVAPAAGATPSLSRTDSASSATGPRAELDDESETIETTELAVWTERDSKSRHRNPPTDYMRQLVSELSLPGDGNSFLIMQREGRVGFYVQVGRTAAEDYVVEYREGVAARHFVVSHLSLSSAQAAICAWASDAPGWQHRWRWMQVPSGEEARTPSSGSPGFGRGPHGMWVSSQRDGVPGAARPAGPQGQRPANTVNEELESSPTHRIVVAPPQPPQSTTRQPSTKARVRRLSPGVKVAIAGAVAIGLLIVIIANLRSGGSETSEPLFVDDFSTQEHGWEGPGGAYVSDMYRIDVAPGVGSTNSPRNPSRVYPSAPSDLRIRVDARSLAPLNTRSGYGVICRLNEDTGDRYQFTIGDGADTVRITKFVADRPEFLATETLASINVTEVNRIQADCTTAEAGADGEVRLVFRLNDQVVAEATDNDQTLTDGTIGIRVAAPAAPGQEGVQAEFDDFVVTSL
jgi:CHAT domain